MQRLLPIACAAAAASLAACGPQSEPKEQANSSTVAASPATPAKPAENFRSSVAPTSPPDSPTAADTNLSNRVRSTLTQTAGMEIGGVQITAANGVVTLYGTVDAASEKDRAAILALGIDGVRSVVNQLVVMRGS